MTSSRVTALLTVGVLAGGIALWAGRTTSLADTKSANYIGSKKCLMCHKGKSPAIVDGWTKTGHPKALQAAADPGAIVAVFDAASPVKKNDIKLVLGKGILAQAYIGADGKVLPAQWNAVTKKWEPIASDDAAVKCLGCHTTGYKADAKSYTDAGISCEACHGPGSEHFTGGGDKTKIVNPGNLPKDRAMMICGSCHSKGMSVDKIHPFPVNFRPGDDLAATFVDAKPTTPGRNQQYSEFLTSKHAKIGMTCKSCHDPHGTTGIAFQLKKPKEELCKGCHGDKAKDMIAHMEASGHAFK